MFLSMTQVNVGIINCIFCNLLIKILSYDGNVFLIDSRSGLSNLSAALIVSTVNLLDLNIISCTEFTSIIRKIYSNCVLIIDFNCRYRLALIFRYSLCILSFC